MLIEEMWKGRFKDSELTQQYFELCSKSTDQPKYFHKHHILPRSMWPEYEFCNWNIVKLTYENHYLAHEKLPLMCMLKEDKDRMASAWWLMSHTLEGISLSAELYAELRTLALDARLGKEMSAEQKVKIAKTLTGRKRPQEVVDKVAAKMRGKKASVSTLRKMSDAQKGRVKSEQECKNISLSKQGSKHPLYGVSPSEITRQRLSDSLSRFSYEQYDLDGNLVKLWSGIAEIVLDGNFNQHHVTNVCNGKRKTHKGFIWKKVLKQANS